MSKTGTAGNSRRVGHDISPYFTSMLSLVDIGSGLGRFVHNATATGFGYYADLDMLEIGNSPDFNCDESPAALERCRYHMSLWSCMKAPLIIGNDLRHMSNTSATFGVLANEAAVRVVNQDPLVNPGRRVATARPRNDTLAGAYNFGIISVCNRSKPTQRWRFVTLNSSVTSSPSAATYLYLDECDAASAAQQWTFEPSGQLRNAASGSCVDPTASGDPVGLAPCATPATAAQTWLLNAENGHISHAATGVDSVCLDVDDFHGPDLDVWPCKTPGSNDRNQRFSYNAATKQLRVASNSGKCVAALPAPPTDGRGLLQTTDIDGRGSFCLSKRGASGYMTMAPCPTDIAAASRGGFLFGFSGAIGAKKSKAQQLQQPSSASSSSSACNSIAEPCSLGIWWNTQTYSSGPIPHSRPLTTGPSFDASLSTGAFRVDKKKLASREGDAIRAWDTTNIINDNNVGHVSVGGEFCLDAAGAGWLEVWASQLKDGKIAVVLANRSPSTDLVTFTAEQIGATAGAAYGIYDVWEKQQLPSQFTGSMTVPVRGYAVKYFILSP